MKARIDVESKREGEQIRAGLARPDVRAFVKVMGILDALPSDRARARTLAYVTSKLDDDRVAAAMAQRPS